MIRFVVLFSLIELAQCWASGYVGSSRSRHNHASKLLSVVASGHDDHVLCCCDEWARHSEEDVFRLQDDFKGKKELFIVRSTATTSLSKFQSLMGSLYGLAGLAHFADLLLGESTLLAQAGAPPFQELDPLGQAYALLWCASGPVAFLASRAARDDGADDDAALDSANAGLVFYGVVEVGGAFLLKQAGFDSDLAVINAFLVQVLVGASWLFSSRKTD
jgi:hypothetical protein